MTDFGIIQNYIEISVNCNRQKQIMELDQSKYIESLAEKYGTDNMRKYKTPMEKNLNLPCSVDCYGFVSDFRKLVGALLIVGSGTRFDVSYAINYLSIFQKYATKTHFRYALRVL